MGRKLRTIEDGLVYHIVNRDNDKSYIFNSDIDKMSFIVNSARHQGIDVYVPYRTYDERLVKREPSCASHLTY